MEEEDRKGLMTVLIWLGISAAVLLVAAAAFRPHLTSSRPKARRINCAGNLKQIGLALIIYAGDDVDEGKFPNSADFSALHDGHYLMDGKVYACPSASHQRRSARDSNYVYLGRGMTDMHPDPTRTILAHDRLDNHPPDGGAGWVNCLYVDGHVQGHKTTAATWEAFRAEREAAGDIIVNTPLAPGSMTDGALPDYQRAILGH